MKNLAGVKEADEYIQEELILAGIPLIRGKENDGMVPYSITGKLGNWTFERARYYWMASAPKKKGLPLEVAVQLYERQYPVVGKNQPDNYGQVVRVEGNADGPHPNARADHYDIEGNLLIIDPDGKLKLEQDRLFEKHPEFLSKPGFQELKTAKYIFSLEGIVSHSYVNGYHIDNQIGLNEFARVLREL